MSFDSGDLPTTMLRVSRISTPKASDVLAEQLRERIRSGAWPEGRALPTERMLAEQSGVSRTTVREALRMLEIDGLIEIRPGRGGGARVRRPGGGELLRQLELFIWGRNIAVDHLSEVRESLEALAAHGAALRRTDEELAELVALTAEVEASVGHFNRYLDANLAWHMAVVRASHNELLIRFMDVLSGAIHRATESEAFDTPEVRSATLRIHRAILEAIAAGDAESARRRMARHVHAAHEMAEQFQHGRTGKSGDARPAATSPSRPSGRRAKVAPPAPKGTPATARRSRTRTSKEAK